MTGAVQPVLMVFIFMNALSGRSGRQNSTGKRRKNPMMENNRPWDDPKVQMMLQMFNGVITAVTPLNIREVNSDGTTR